MAEPGLEQARRHYAEELRRAGSIRSSAVAGAFATVPREHFLGPPPWTVFAAGGGPVATDDPRDLCSNVLVAIDRRRGINNGEPLLWGLLFDRLDLAPGQRVVHVGAGTGYYSAILAEIVGPEGSVEAVEIDPELAPRASRNLAYLPQARLIEADGFTYRSERAADAVVVNAGVATLSEAWLDSLAPDGGRLLVPITTVDQSGGFVLIRRGRAEDARYAVDYMLRTGIISCVGHRPDNAEMRLHAALARGKLDQVRSLRRAPEPPDETCWLAGEGWWLSTAPVDDRAKPPLFTLPWLPGRRRT